MGSVHNHCVWFSSGDGKVGLGPGLGLVMVGLWGVWVWHLLGWVWFLRAYMKLRELKAYGRECSGGKERKSEGRIEQTLCWVLAWLKHRHGLCNKIVHIVFIKFSLPTLEDWQLVSVVCLLVYIGNMSQWWKINKHFLACYAHLKMNL